MSPSSEQCSFFLSLRSTENYCFYLDNGNKVNVSLGLLVTWACPVAQTGHLLQEELKGRESREGLGDWAGILCAARHTWLDVRLRSLQYYYLSSLQEETGSQNAN